MSGSVFQDTVFSVLLQTSRRVFTVDYCNCLFFSSCYLAGKTERSSYLYGRESNPHCHQVSFLFSSAQLLVTFMCRVLSKPVAIQPVIGPKLSRQSSRAHGTEHTRGMAAKMQTRVSSVKGLQVKWDVFRWKCWGESPIRIVWLNPEPCTH